MKHATVQIGNMTIPLIGIAPEATLEECDCCHDIFSIRQVELVGRQFLCQKCKTDLNAENAENVKSF